MPELVFDVDKFVAKVRKLLEKKYSVVVAVSEGIKTADGKYVCELGSNVDFVDAFGHKQLTGTANYLASLIAGEIGCKTRGVELSTLQRAASVSYTHLLIFGQWRSNKILMAAFFFGIMKTLASAYSAIPFLKSLPIPNELYKMIPYIATLIVLAFSSKNSQAPRAEGIPYDKGSS